jgi:hypothetical protein
MARPSVAARVTLLVGVLLLTVAPAAAQTAEQDAVRNRDRPEFAPLGLELDQLFGSLGLVDRKTVEDKSSALSSFTFYPKAEVAADYETNLFRDNTRQADRILVLSPGFAVRSDWGNHSLALAVDTDIGRHDRHPSEDYDDVRATLDGRFDAADNFQLNGLVQVGQEHLKRGTLLDNGRTTSAVIYRRSVAGFGARYTSDRILVRPQFKVTGEDYLVSDGQSNDDLDRVIAEVNTRIAYEWLPGTAVFVEPSYNNRDYRLARDFSGFLQNSHGYQMLVGVTWDVSGVTFLEFGTGYLRQEFDDPAFGTVQGPALSGRLVWNPLDSVTFELRVVRDVEERRQQSLAGVLVTSIRSRLDYEMLYNVILSLRLDYADEADQNAPRDDNRFNTGVEARYLVDQHWYAGLAASYEKLNSNVDDAGYSNVLLSLRVGAQL